MRFSTPDLGAFESRYNNWLNHTAAVQIYERVTAAKRDGSAKSLRWAMTAIFMVTLQRSDTARRSNHCDRDRIRFLLCSEFCRHF